jgi:guanylate kinase
VVVDSAAIQGRPLLVIIGPSACGKSTLVRRLAERGAIRVHPTWTTRPPRADEDPTDETLEHRFVDEARFRSLETEDFFLGTTQMFGLPHHYGLPRFELQPSGPIDAVMLRAPLVEQLRALMPSLLVYHIDSDLEEAARRLADRSVDDAEAQARAAANEAELEQGRQIADRTFTNDGDMDDLVESVLVELLTDYGPSIHPPGSPDFEPPAPPSVVPSLRAPVAQPGRPGAQRKRSLGEKILIGVGAIAAVLVAGIVVVSLIFMYALSQWSSNK